MLERRAPAEARPAEVTKNPGGRSPKIRQWPLTSFAVKMPSIAPSRITQPVAVVVDAGEGSPGGCRVEQHVGERALDVVGE